MNYLVAVSGGVDSVVLLDMLVREARGKRQEARGLVVAHVDHGIREESAADARFVEKLAEKYQLPFVSTRLELGAQASEQQARDERYEFLFAQAARHSATIVTAHHQDDAVETVAINLERGTGWRGLAVLSRAGIQRPLLSLSKQQLYDYALTHRLEWVEDNTNASTAYLRNRLRKRIAPQTIDTVAVMQLRARQLQLRTAIDNEVDRLVARHAGSRYFLTHVDESTAVELLGRDIELQCGVRPTKPQLVRAVLYAKTAKSGSSHHVGDKVQLTFSPRKYQISML